ncbi:MAG: hypothetical protein ACFFBL_13455 [Promethearchaeota archaeon]
MNETIIGNIGVSIDTGWFGSLIFTSNRLIIARTEQKRYSQEHTSYLTRIILNRLRGKEIEEDKNRERMYLKGHPDNILASDKKNFEIPYSYIISVEIEKPGRVFAGKITISTTTREKPFTYFLREGRALFENHINLLRSLLPSKLVVS